MKNRLKELERAKAINTYNKLDWKNLKTELINNPDMEIKRFERNPRFSDEKNKAHIEKMRVLLHQIEPGYYYHRDQLVDLFKEAGFTVTRPGTTLNKVFDTAYFEESKTYYIIKKL